MLELVAALNAQLARFAPDYVTDPTKAIFRIYRDTRFSADKTPYKTHVAASFRRRGPKHVHLGGFYFSVSSDAIEVAGGLYHPPPETTLLVRTHIAENHPELQRLVANRKARRLVGELQGDELTRAPKGFDPRTPRCRLHQEEGLDSGCDARSRFGNNAEAIPRNRGSLPRHDAVSRIPEPPVSLAQKPPEIYWTNRW